MRPRTSCTTPGSRKRTSADDPFDKGATVFRLGLIGDVMLGRRVDDDLADPHTAPAEVWGDLLPVFSTVDLRGVNLECVISAIGRPDPGRVFHFRARYRALEVLQAAHIDFVGLANNHVLDYGQDALLECVSLLRDHSIAAVEHLLTALPGLVE